MEKENSMQTNSVFRLMNGCFRRSVATVLMVFGAGAVADINLPGFDGNGYYYGTNWYGSSDDLIVSPATTNDYLLDAWGGSGYGIIIPAGDADILDVNSNVLTNLAEGTFISSYGAIITQGTGTNTFIWAENNRSGGIQVEEGNVISFPVRTNYYEASFWLEGFPFEFTVTVPGIVYFSSEAHCQFYPDDDMLPYIDFAPYYYITIDENTGSFSLPGADILAFTDDDIVITPFSGYDIGYPGSGIEAAGIYSNALTGTEVYILEITDDSVAYHRDQDMEFDDGSTTLPAGSFLLMSEPGLIIRRGSGEKPVFSMKNNIITLSPGNSYDIDQDSEPPELVEFYGYYDLATGVFIPFGTPVSVTFDVQGGDPLSTNVIVFTSNYRYGKLPVPVKAGNYFAGWYTAPQGGTKIYAGSLCSDETHTLYAHWNDNIRPVTFDSQGGTAVSNGISVFTGHPYGELPETTKSGYMFVGWFTEPAGGGERAVADTCVSADVSELYAHWVDMNNVYYVVNDEAEIPASTTGTVYLTTHVWKGPADTGTLLGSYSGMNTYDYYSTSAKGSTTLQKIYSSVDTRDAIADIQNDRDGAEAVIWFGDAGMSGNPYMETYNGTVRGAIFANLPGVTHIRGKGSFHRSGPPLGSEGTSPAQSYGGGYTSLYVENAAVRINADLDMQLANTTNGMLAIDGGTNTFSGIFGAGIGVSGNGAFTINGGLVRPLALFAGVYMTDESRMMINGGQFQIMGMSGIMLTGSVSVVVNGGTFIALDWMETVAQLGGDLGVGDLAGLNFDLIRAFAPVGWFLDMGASSDASIVINGGDFADGSAPYMTQEMLMAMLSGSSSPGMDSSAQFIFNGGNFETLFAMLVDDSTVPPLIGSTEFSKEILMTENGAVAVSLETSGVPGTDSFRAEFDGNYEVSFGTKESVSTGYTAGFSSLMNAESFSLSEFMDMLETFPENGQLVVKDGAPYQMNFIPKATPHLRFAVDDGDGDGLYDDLVYTLITPYSVTVTFDTGGPEVIPNQIFCGNFVGLPAPSRSNEVFVGWYTEPDGAGSRVIAKTLVPDVGTMTLYAKWVEMSTYYIFNAVSAGVTNLIVERESSGSRMQIYSNNLQDVTIAMQTIKTDRNNGNGTFVNARIWFGDGSDPDTAGPGQNPVLTLNEPYRMVFDYGVTHLSGHFQSDSFTVEFRDQAAGTWNGNAENLEFFFFNNTKFDFIGGTLTSEYACGACLDDSKITVSGGTFFGENNFGVMDSSTLVINDGNFNSEYVPVYVEARTSLSPSPTCARLFLNGGQFNSASFAPFSISDSNSDDNKTAEVWIGGSPTVIGESSNIIPLFSTNSFISVVTAADAAGNPDMQVYTGGQVWQVVLIDSDDLETVLPENGQLMVKNGAPWQNSFLPAENPSQRFTIVGDDLIYTLVEAMQEFEWHEDEGMIVVTKYNGTNSTMYMAEFFSSMTGKIVIAENAFTATNIRKAAVSAVTLPGNIKEIGGNAFTGTDIPWMLFRTDAPDLPSGNLIEETKTVFYIPGTAGWTNFAAVHTNTVPLGAKIGADFGLTAEDEFVIPVAPRDNIPGELTNFDTIVESTESLTDQNWEILSTNNLNSVFTNDISGAITSRFYRVRFHKMKD